MWEWNKAPPPIFGPWGIMTAWLHSEDTRREWGFRWDTLLSPAVPLSELWTIQVPPMSMWFVCLFPRGLGPLQEAVQPLGSFPDPIFSSTNGCPGSDVTLTNSKTYHPGDNNQDSKKKIHLFLCWYRCLSSPSTTMPYLSPHALSLVTHFD